MIILNLTPCPLRTARNLKYVSDRPDLLHVSDRPDIMHVSDRPDIMHVSDRPEVLDPKSKGAQKRG